MAFVSPSPKQPSPITVGTSKNFIQVGGLAPSNSSGLFSSSFSPLSLSPTVWLRSDLGITQSGGTVSGWNDQSGNGYNVSQATSDLQPAYAASGGANNLPTITWSSAESDNIGLQNTSFTFPISTIEYFIVASTTSPTGFQQYMIDLGQNTNVIEIYPPEAPNYFSAYNGAVLSGNYSISANAAFVVDVMNNDASTSFFNVNGGSPTVGSIGGNSQGVHTLTIGNFQSGGYAWLGVIYEVIIFDYELTSTQRAKVLSYVSSRYGISV
jgi:hypothetical protein